MTNVSERDALIANLDKGITTALRYYETTGATSKAIVGEWGPKETLAHLINWHRLTAEGMESVVKGGAPAESEDDENNRAVAKYRNTPMSQLVKEARAYHQRLLKAARTLPDIDTVVLRRKDGATSQSARRRLTRLPEHWTEHVEELKKAEPAAKKPTGR